MSKAKQKQLQRLRLQKQNKDHEYEVALKRLINQDQTLRISLDYCEKYLQNEVTQSLEEYSPIHISRMIFDKQLQKIEKQMNRIPDQSCRIEHFIVIMLKVLKLPFDKLPLYMIGLKDLFREIAQEGKDVITYSEIFKYCIGEVIIMKEEQRNTEFHIQFSEKKKQDFLLHDNGIKKVYYSNDLKAVISLDYREQTIKVYDQDMRNISRFSARKDMHNNRVPQIIDFDYSQISMRLGIIFADKTIESIHLPHYINKTQTQFQSTTLNQLLFHLPKPMKKIYYIHMLNKWLTISDQIDELYLFDMQKVRLKPQEVMEKITIDTNQMPIHIILQIVPLSVICVVAGNQISFFSENFKQQKYSKYIHHQQIWSLKYCEEKSTFYLLGSYEKCLTLFTVNRNKSSFKIWTIGINKVISDFEVFPFYDTVLICDELHDLRLLHEPTLKVYKQQSYGHIVKVQNEPLRCYKTSKTDFMVYQTYMIGLEQQKVAIERDIELNFANCYHYDHKKQEFYFSFNDQIVCFSLLFGDIRKNYNTDTSNLTKHDCFFLGKNTHPFLIDKDQTIYELYMKNAQIQGENKSYRRKLAVKDAFRYFYDQQMRNVMIISGNTITQIRNDYHNNFNSINTINLDGFAKIVQARFCKTSKYLTFLTADSLIYQLQNFQRSISKCFKVEFFREKNDLEAIILDFNYCYQFEVVLILNSNREIFIFSRHDISNYVSIDLTEYLPYKLKGLSFNKLVYTNFKDKGKQKPSIILCDETGFILDINLESIFYRQFANNKKEDLKIKLFIKETYDVANDSSKVQIVRLNKSKKVMLKQSQLVLQRAHEKQISIVTKVPLQLSVVLSISKDGYIKLWSQSYECLFSLKLPNLMKAHWNMKEIHTIKNNKSIKEINEIIKLHYSHNKQTIEPVEALIKTRKFKHTIELPKTSKFLQQLPLQIDSKEVEDIITKQENYNKIFLTSRVNRAKVKYNPEKTAIDSHPWRTRKEFVKIYEKASPPNKYAKSMPKNLISLRTSLDMAQRKKKKENYQAAELILPMLKSYENQIASKNDTQSTKPKRQEEEFQAFESCIYLKTQRHRKKPNELDEIDREFMRKQIELKKRRQSNRYRQENKSLTIDLSESTSLIAEESRYDTIRDIKSVFQEHNRECLQGKKGRIIKVPQISLRSEDQ